jgi:hypothetical protein
MAAKHVNFLETSSIAQSKVEANYLVIILISAVTVVASLGLIFWQESNLDKVITRRDELSVEVSQLSASRNAKLGNKTSKAAKEQLRDPVSWSNLLREIGQSMPASMRLSQIAGALRGTRAVTLKGYASNIQSIFWLKNNLAALPECEKASVATFGRVNSDGVDESSFQLECKLR